MERDETRPIFLNLLRIRQPVTAIASIVHRITGVMLFLLSPLLIYSLELSLRSPSGYDAARMIWSSTGMRSVAILFVWWFIYHLFNGVRFLFIDIDLGVEKTTANRSAWFVIVASLVMTVVAAGCLL